MFITKKGNLTQEDIFGKLAIDSFVWELNVFLKRRCRTPKGALALKVRDYIHCAWAG